MNNLILTDCDGVLLDWLTTFDDYMTLKGLPSLPDMEHEYRLALRYGVGMDEIDDIVKEFNSSDYMVGLTPYLDAVDNVKRLHKQGYEFIVITAMSSCAYAREKRIRNLDLVFGEGVFNHNEMVCINPHESKFFHLKKWQGSGAYWIDDHFMHAEAGHEVGLKTMLMDAPYNRHYQTDLFPRVHSWKQIFDMITGA